MMNTAVHVAARIMEARALLGPSEGEAAVQRAIAEVAAHRRLHHMHAPDMVVGRVEGMHMELRATMEGSRRGWVTDPREPDRALLAVARAGAGLAGAQHGAAGG
jgi:hypothetical protein